MLKENNNELLNRVAQLEADLAKALEERDQARAEAVRVQVNVT